ncbi:MAG: Dabb family protein [Proteobacteria bacterium]|nr:Dabb family protein [Pseudomonadota bacterium]
MIRHIVFFSAKDAQDIARMEQGLSLLAQIPECLHFEVSRNSKRDGLSQEIDLVVYAEFADYEALARYKQHANYQESIRLVRPLRELRLAVDFEATAADIRKAAKG